jgi:hypothetical protein
MTALQDTLGDFGVPQMDSRDGRAVIFQVKFPTKLEAATAHDSSSAWACKLSAAGIHATLVQRSPYMCTNIGARAYARSLVESGHGKN